MMARMTTYINIAKNQHMKEISYVRTAKNTSSDSTELVFLNTTSQDFVSFSVKCSATSKCNCALKQCQVVCNRDGHTQQRRRTQNSYVYTPEPPTTRSF